MGKLNNSYIGFIDQGSLVKMEYFSLTPDQKHIEIKIKPVAGFAGDRVLSGLKNVFSRKVVTLPIDNKEYIKEITDNRLYPVFGYGIQGTPSGKVAVFKCSTQNVLSRRLMIANEKISMLEEALKSYVSTVKFMSQSEKDKFFEIMEMVKEARKIAEPVSSEYFTYTYPIKREEEEVE